MVFRGETPRELRQSIGLQAHGTVVVNIIMSCVENLNQPEYVRELLSDTIQGHVTVGVRREQFQVKDQTQRANCLFK